MSLALILGGGAPNMTIMSGALLALDERDVTFDVISTSGAGMLIGLLYAAPKGCSRREALRATPDLAVSDPISRLFPIDFRVFHKAGPLASAYTAAMQPWLNLLPHRTPTERMLRDCAELVSAAFCPTDLTPWSQGLCEPAPWISDVVDFDALKRFPGEIYMCAYSIDRHAQRIFKKDEITAEHFKAGLSMPFIYAPYSLDGETFIEGCANMTLNYQALVDRTGAAIDHAVVFDVIGHEKIIQEPRSLYEALNQMIMVPLTRLAKYETDHFVNVTSKQKNIGTDVLLLDFEDLIPDSHWPDVLHWSESNMSFLFDVGYRAGQRFFERHGPALSGCDSHDRNTSPEPLFYLAAE